MDEATHEFDHLEDSDDPRDGPMGWHEHDHNHPEGEPGPFHGANHGVFGVDHRHYHTRVGKSYDHHPVPAGDVRPATVADHDNALD